MEDNRGHKVVMTDRKNMLVTDVIDVDSFNLTEILLETGQGTILVKGNDIHVKRLNLERGEADIEGKFDSIVYTKDKGKSDSLLKRMFK
jgi:sporulation protein YabP